MCTNLYLWLDPFWRGTEPNAAFRCCTVVGKGFALGAGSPCLVCYTQERDYDSSSFWLSSKEQSSSLNWELKKKTPFGQ